jgi:hypothetical protein
MPIAPPAAGGSQDRRARERRLIFLVAAQRLRTATKRVGDPPTRRLITSVEPAVLLKLEQKAAGSRFRPLNRLTRYWRVDLRGRGWSRPTAWPRGSRRHPAWRRRTPS